MQTGGKQLKLIGFIFSFVLMFNLNSVSAQEEPVEGGDVSSGSTQSAPTINTFQYTGAAVSSIPILIPPGRNGITPKLALTYNSYRKNGWVGVGWDLDMGAIQRSTKRGVCYECDDYVASMNGSSSELVARPDWGPDYYGAKIEGAFTRYRYNGSNGWEVTTKDGTTYYYGQSPESRQDDPRDSARVFKWCLDKVEDSNGNYMQIYYDKYAGEIYQGQIYLERIEYTASADLGPSNTVNFYLQDRPDSGPLLTTNFEVNTAKRLYAIEIRAQNQLVRAYQLAYTISESTSRSLLKTVVQFGSNAKIDGYGNITQGSSLPAITYDWQKDASNTFTNVYFTRSTMEGYSIGSLRDRAFAFDYNGDGKKDLFFYRPDSGYVGVIRSNGDGTFTNVYLSTSGIAGYDLRGSRDQVFPFDYNGDGLSDLFLYRPDSNVACVARSNGDGSFSSVYFSHSGMEGYSIGSKRDRAFPFDYNGDGKSDIFLYRPDSGYVGVNRSNGDGTFTNVYLSTSGIAGYDLRGSRDQVFPFDYNGDGLSDLFLFRPDSNVACVARSNGDGSFSNVYFSHNGMEGYSIGSKRDRAFPFDYNGDGKSDIFLYRPDSGYVGVNRSNGDGTFTNVYLSTSGIAGYDLRGSRDQVFPFDYNGDGSSDLFLFRPDSGKACVARSNGDGTFSRVYFSNSGIAGYDLKSERDRAFSFDYNGNGKGDIFLYRPDSYAAMVVRSGLVFPDLLTGIDNGLGTETQVKYTDSSHYDNKILPFIVYPVSKVTFIDETNRASTIAYSYLDGHFDAGDREFRGFGRVTKINPEGAVSEVQYHQGGYLKGRQNIALAWEYEGGPPISATYFDWQRFDVEDQSKYVFLQNKITQIFENGQLSIETQEDYDYYSQNGLLRTTTSQIISGGEGEALTTEFEYQNYGDWRWRKTKQTIFGSTNDIVRESYFTHDSAGNLILEEHWNNNPDDPTNPVTRREYYADGNLWKVYDPNGNPATIYEYDSATHTYPVKITYPPTNGVSHVVQNEKWDYRFGKPTITKDENGNRSYYVYDQFGRPRIQVHTPDGGMVTTEYYDHEIPRHVITRASEDYSGNSIDNYQYFDGLGRQIQTISFGEEGKSIVTRYYYDKMGRNDLVAGPFFATGVGFPIEPPELCPKTLTTFDKRGRPLVVENSDGVYGSVAATFSYSGLATTVTDPDGGSKTEKKDYLGRVIEVIEHANEGNYATHYGYNAAGDLLEVTDAMGNVTSMSYDSLGRKIDMIDPDMGYWKYTYDANGNLITQTDAKGQRRRFHYDPINRVYQKEYLDTADSSVDYVYDLGINGIGRLYSASNAAGETIYDEYDSLGQVLSVTRSISGAPLSAYTTTYSYDLTGKLKSMTYPGGYQVNYDYHPGSGLLHTVTGITDFTEYTELTGYGPTGKIGDIYHGNGAETFYRYDTQSTRLLSIQTTDPNLADLQHKTYMYTPAGDIKSITRVNGGQSITYDYAYDKLHRLIAETNSGGSDDFDPSMLIKAFDDAAPIHAVKSVNFNGSNYPYDYDGNGNMIQSWDFTSTSHPVERVIEYNTDNMPVKIKHKRSSGTVAVDLSYDGDGVRVKKTFGGSTIYYIGEHFEVADGVEIKYIFAGNLRIAKVTTTEKHFYHKDHLGSSTVITNYSDGSVIESAEYLPFGLYRKHSETEVTYYKFSDQELDAEVGLYNYNARLYDPAIGIFISPDSIVPDFTNPQSLNRYSYALNNPLKYVDPSGHNPFVIGAIVGAVIGAVSAGAQSDWDAGSMLQGAAMGGVTGAISAGVFTGASGFVGSQVSHIGLAGGIGPPTFGMTAVGNIVGSVAGGAASGATVGGLSAAFYGGDIGEGVLEGAWKGAAFSAVMATLSSSADYMRREMIEQSLLNPTGANSGGNSVGFKGDGFKLGGGRWVEGLPARQQMPSVLGGIQGGQGWIGPWKYNPGSWCDYLVEAYAGPHDYFNSGYWYNAMGNVHNLTGFANFLGQAINYTNVLWVTPIVAASVVPGYSYPVIANYDNYRGD